MRKEYDMEDYDFGKNSMTITDIIARLERIDRGWIPDWNYTGEENDYENYLDHVAMWKAIEALKNKAEGD